MRKYEEPKLEVEIFAIDDITCSGVTLPDDDITE